MIGDPVMPEAQRFIDDQIRQDLASAMPWNYGFGSFLVILARVVRRLGCATLPQNGVNLQGWPVSPLTNRGISWVTTKVRIMPKLSESSALH
jgi:hypothetical protein